MPKTTNYRSGSIRRVEWGKLKEGQHLSEENIEKVFHQEGKLLEQEGKAKDPGCFACLRRSRRPPYLALLTKEEHKSGKLTIFEDKNLGEGSYGRVLLGKLKARNKKGRVNKMKIAVKCINHQKLRNKDYTDEEIVSMIGKEVRAQNRCQHPNVIALQFVIVYHHETLIGMELAGHGALKNHISHQPKVTSMQYFTKVMEAVNFCHARGVVHLDIKPGNVLLDEELNVKIADFGLSEMVGDDSFMIEPPGGTPHYMAPEILYEDLCNGSKCDIWSLGVMMYKLLLNRYPFDEDELDSLNSEISYMRMKRKSQDQIQEYLEEVFNIDKVYFPPTMPIAPKIIICAMLNFDPLKRPSLDQILALSWVSKFRVQN